MFKDRKEAGKLLAEKLSQYKNKKDALVLAIPRGGVETAYEIAMQLKLPLDVVVIKKIGFPGNEELAIGAVGVDASYIHKEFAHYPSIPRNYIQSQITKKQQEARKRSAFLRDKKPLYKVKNKIVIIIDDGIATGATMLMAIKILKKQFPQKVIVAIPVAPPDTVRRLEKEADKVICLEKPSFFAAISQFYDNFPQVEDEEVKRLLKEARG